MATVKWKTSVSFVFYVCLLFIQSSRGRDHEINLEDEERRTFELSKFGFLQGGILKVNFSDMTFTSGVNSRGQDNEKDYSFGFSLEKTTSDGVSPYMEQHADKCILGNYEKSFKQHISVALIKFNLSDKKIVIEKFGEDFSNLHVSVNEKEIASVATTVTTTAATDDNVATNATSNATVTNTTTAAAKTITAAVKAATEGATTAATNDNVTTNATSNATATNAEAKTTTAAAAKIITTAVKTATKGVTTAATNANVTTDATSNATATKAEANATTSAVQTTIAVVKTTTDVAPTTTTKPDENSAATLSKNSSIAIDNLSTNISRTRRSAKKPKTNEEPPSKSLPIELPLGVTMINESKFYSGNFVVRIKAKAEEGLYNLYFHNCANYKKDRKANVQVNIKVHIMEKNGDNYLSAGEAPLPYMFGILSVIFLGTAMYWFHILRQNREYTYKVHYMMFVLILLKALDLAFQAVNNHFISTDGKPEESWAVLYYITHLLKGALLFTTIVLIGTGYFFIKHVLSDRDKKIFIIVIPLQILANTAQIVMESTEEAKLHYTTWKEVFILVDLLCCGAILFPVVWSIRHLQEASQTDGKAAISLAKLKLFRHFYVMIVCYIYFTRIIVYLIKITVPFQYMWLDDFFNNVASYVFFVLTGYKFRPAPDNPYLHVPQDDSSDEEVQMEEVVTTAGLAKGVTRLQPSSEGRKIFETA